MYVWEPPISFTYSVIIPKVVVDEDDDDDDDDDELF